MDYLPNALAFVFVINVAAAGGLQKDRVTTCFTSFNKVNVKANIFFSQIL